MLDLNLTKHFLYRISMFDIFRSDALSHDTCNDIDDAALRQSFSLSKLRLMNLLYIEIVKPAMQMALILAGFESGRKNRFFVGINMLSLAMSACQ